MNDPRPSKSKRARAKTRPVPREKIPNRTTFSARVDKDLLKRVDVATKRRRSGQPSFNRTDALHAALTMWAAAEEADAAKGGAQ